MGLDTLQSIGAGVRIVLVTLAICVAGYTAAILAVAQLLTPHTANGWLVTTVDGAVVGSRQIAQPFTKPRYFWPRPSAVDYDGAGAGGSNLSPTSTELAERGEALVERYDATPRNPMPPELAATSGSGLDPHISERAARYQAARVANGRGLPQSRVETLITEHAFAPGGALTAGRIVNVLELNLALDRAARPDTER